MGQPRPKPQRLAEKLLAVRHRLRASQSEMIAMLGMALTAARISEYESGTRVPNLMVLLAYSRAARVTVEVLIDDALDLPALRKK